MQCMCSHSQASINFLPESRPWYPPAQEHRHSLPKRTTSNGDTENGQPLQLSSEGSPGPDTWRCDTCRETWRAWVGGDAALALTCNTQINRFLLWAEWNWKYYSECFPAGSFLLYRVKEHWDMRRKRFPKKGLSKIGCKFKTICDLSFIL